MKKLRVRAYETIMSVCLPYDNYHYTNSTDLKFATHGENEDGNEDNEEDGR